MKICVIEEKDFELFETYIPTMYRNVFEKNECVAFGFYDKDGIHGAGVVEVNVGEMDILSIVYDKTVEPGVCEKLLTETLMKSRKHYDFDQIVFVKEGLEEALFDYDFVMMDEGYFPRKGTVDRYSSTIKKIFFKQKEMLKHVDEIAKTLPIKSAKDLTDNEIGRYNMLHPDNPFVKSEQDLELSHFYFKDNVPVGAIFARKTETGEIAVSWMDTEMIPEKQMAIYMIFSAISKARRQYDMDTEIIVYPYLTDVIKFLTKLDFGLSETKIKTRIYTRYLDIA